MCQLYWPRILLALSLRHWAGKILSLRLSEVPLNRTTPELESCFARLVAQLQNWNRDANELLRNTRTVSYYSRNFRKCVSRSEFWHLRARKSDRSHISINLLPDQTPVLDLCDQSFLLCLSSTTPFLHSVVGTSLELHLFWRFSGSGVARLREISETQVVNSGIEPRPKNI